MFRISRMVKLVGVVMMSALLLWLPMQVASQPAPAVPKRSQIIEGIKAALSVKLTAAEGDILNSNAAAFISHPRVTFAYIPLHPSSRSVQLLQEWLTGKQQVGPVNLGALYLENDLPDTLGFFGLKAGFYLLKVTHDLKLIAIDPMGDEIHIGFMRIQPIGNPLWKVALAVAAFCAAVDVSVTVQITESVSVTVGC